MAIPQVTKEEMKNYLEGVHQQVISFPERVNGLLNPTYLDCDPEEKTVLLEFSIKDWELNLVGNLHGGIMMTMLDHTCGVAAASLSQAWCPTIDLHVHFLRPGFLNHTYLAKGKVISFGAQIIHTEASLTDKETGKVVATCTGTFLHRNE